MKTIKDILTKAKIDENGNLDESIVSELESAVNEIVEIRTQSKAQQLIREQLDPVISKTKEELTVEYESKFEEYKNDITEKFSAFCDSVLDEELEIPEEVQDWAAKGRRYGDLIEALRARIAVDEGAVTLEMQQMAEEASKEITSLRAQLNEKLAAELENNTKSSEMQQMAEEASKEIANLRAQLTVHENYSYLTPKQREQVIALIGRTVKNENINEEIAFIVKNLVSEDPGTPLGQEKTPVQAEVSKKCKCPVCGKVVDVADSNTACSALKCPDCDDVHLEDCKDCTESSKNSVKNYELTESYVTKAAKMYAQLID